MNKRAFIALALAGTLGVSTATLAAENTNTKQPAASASALTPAQVKQIQQVVHDYLVNNPQVLIEASQSLQRQEIAKVQSRARDAIAKNAKAIFADPQSPVVGNPQGDVTLVEFMDYQCGHCKTMGPIIDQLLKKDPQLRVVIKELPIFGASSEYAAKAALASQKQGKFWPFHQALLTAAAPLSQDQVLQIAKSVGIDTAQLQQDMQNDVYTQQLQSDLQLAQTLGLMGTPAFVIGNRQGTQNAFMPGATTAQTLQQMITQVRNKK